MKINMPVTNNEYVLKEADYVISKTDLKGRITHVNETFVNISGFAREELIGAPHNIVRHPDMPPEAFADLWRTLNAGNTWIGLVKNRCKNGDFYWVQANASPFYENGQLIGYTSIRTKPERAKVDAAAKVYRQFREGRASGLKICDGKVVSSGVLSRISMLIDLNIKSRLVAVFTLLSLLAIVLGAIGLLGMSKANDGLRTVYEDRTIPLGQLGEIKERLTHIRTAIVTGISFNAEIPKQHEEIEHDISAINKNWVAYMATYLTPEEKKLADKFSEDLKTCIENGTRPTMELQRSGKSAEAKQFYWETMRPVCKPVSEGMASLLKLQVDVAKDEYDHSTARYSLIRNIAIASIILGLSLAALAALMLIRSIMHALNNARETACSVAAGDLVTQLNVDKNDEVGQLLRSMRVMQMSMRGLISEIKDSTGTINIASKEIASGNSDLSQRTEEQASSLEETASSMEELTTTVRQNAENAKQANQLAIGASDVAGKGGAVVSQVVATMESINASSRKIADIISVIDGIAFQTNILALNAAVEAARAGEQGRGFAVVAGEVRNLAQRSAAAAKEIKTLIENSVSQIEGGSKLVGEAGQTMEEIVSSIKRVTDIMSEITAASVEQSRGIEQVNLAITQMDEATQQNAALVEEAAAAAESLEEQAQNLAASVATFKVDDQTSQAVTTRASAAAPVAQASVRQAKAPVRNAVAAPISGPGQTPAIGKSRSKASEGAEWQEF